MFTKKTINDIDVRDKRVLLRADYNVPIRDDGTVGGDYRIRQSIPTIKALLSQGVRLTICSHLGRPEGKPDPKASLRPVASRLSEFLGQEVRLAPDCVGEETERLVAELQQGQVLLLENLRFHPEEEANDDGFAARLAQYGDVFVQDGFGVVHRAHASTEAITRHLPSVAGLLLAREVDIITNVMANPKRPLVAIIGGAKIADKIEVLTRLVDLADFIAIGGAMGNTFLAAQGVRLGKSRYDKDELSLASEIMEKAEAKAEKSSFVLYLPQDVVVAVGPDTNARTRVVDLGTDFVSEAQAYPNLPAPAAHSVAPDEMVLDIGPFSAAFIAGACQLAGTVVWNGTLGITEIPARNQAPIGPFAHGTELLIQALTGDFGGRPFTLVGGGDTTGYVEERKLTNAFNHVSTGGGASLELMSGKRLPGLEALMDK